MNMKNYIRRIQHEARKLKIGDMITAYHKGWHIITKITPRADAAPLVEYRTIMDSAFNIINSQKIRACDASYCQVITIEMLKNQKDAQIAHFQKGYDDLINILNNPKE